MKPSRRFQIGLSIVVLPHLQKILWYDSAAMDYTSIITIEPDKRSGKPCIRGTRMTVTDVLEYLAGGMSPDEIVAEFPDVSLDDIRACLAFAADRERKLASLPA